VTGLETVDPEETEFGWEVRFSHSGKLRRGGFVHAELLGTLVLLL
jgi:hypothetical protein